MLRRLLPLVLLAPLLAFGAAAPAQADPVPAQGKTWPTCHHGSDTDGRYCVVSVTRSGRGPLHPAYETPGTYPHPFVTRSGTGDVHLGLDTVVVHGDLSTDETPGVPGGDSWTYTVNTGSIRPAELSATARDASLSLGGKASSGYTFTVTLTPTAVAWLAPPASCTYDGGCPDDATADQSYAHYADGVVTDDAAAGLTPSELAARRGLVQATSAQDSHQLYVDSLTVPNTVELRMANPRFTAAGPAVLGTYRTFLPNRYVTRVLRVPDPSALTAATLSVVAVSTGPGALPVFTYTVSHTSRGVRLALSGLTFPHRVVLRVHPAQTAPGAPRWGSVRRTSAHAVQVSFKAPLADGGTPVTSYRARCRGGSGAWHTVTGTSSPITVDGLPRRGVSCQTQADNALGWGARSSTRGE